MSGLGAEEFLELALILGKGSHHLGILAHEFGHVRLLAHMGELFLPEVDKTSGHSIKVVGWRGAGHEHCLLHKAGWV